MTSLVPPIFIILNKKKLFFQKQTVKGGWKTDKLSKNYASSKIEYFCATYFFKLTSLRQGRSQFLPKKRHHLCCGFDVFALKVSRLKFIFSQNNINNISIKILCLTVEIMRESMIIVRMFQNSENNFP